MEIERIYSVKCLRRGKILSQIGLKFPPGGSVVFGFVASRRKFYDKQSEYILPVMELSTKVFRALCLYDVYFC